MSATIILYVRQTLKVGFGPKSIKFQKAFSYLGKQPIAYYGYQFSFD